MTNTTNSYDKEKRNSLARILIIQENIGCAIFNTYLSYYDGLLNSIPRDFSYILRQTETLWAMKFPELKEK